MRRVAVSIDSALPRIRSDTMGAFPSRLGVDFPSKRLRGSDYCGFGYLPEQATTVHDSLCLTADAIIERMKVSEVLRLLGDDGWFLVATKGSHRQFKHAIKAGRVTVPGKPSDDIGAGTLNSVLKQAGLKR
jgi:predicted RNA binding protein YcfA (HicA-like mRNA interferase family)